MSHEEINDIKDERDCEKCVWRSEAGCTVWDCDYLNRNELFRFLYDNPEVREEIRVE